MKKMARVLLYLCLLLLVFCFSACGSKETEKASDAVAVSEEAKEEKEDTKKEKKKEQNEKKDKKDSSEKEKETETEEETEEALITEEETEEVIQVSEGQIRIVVSFSGEDAEALMLTSVLRPNGPDGIEVTASSDDGKLTMTLSDLSAAYDFHLYMGDSPEASTELFNYDVSVKVYLPDNKKPVSYKLSEHMDQIYQDPSGMVLWGAFGILEGDLTDYDPSWIFMA